jgi:hypothetical protein
MTQEAQVVRVSLTGGSNDLKAQTLTLPAGQAAGNSNIRRRCFEQRREWFNSSSAQTDTASFR